jgi:hypothetical protein
MSLLLLLNITATFILIGLIWTIQIVHYPLFAKVGSLNFSEFHITHSRNITMIVLPLMLLELSTSILLVNQDNSLNSILGLCCVGIVWASTFYLQVPIHNQLALNFDLFLIEKLVFTNWIRTIFWSIKGVLGFLILYRL